MVLPHLQTQFICQYDMRDSFNATTTLEEFYQQEILPDYFLYNNTLGNQESAILNLHSIVQMSGIEDIPPTRWYYSSCNTSSPQVLITMDIFGSLSFDMMMMDNDDDNNHNNNHTETFNQTTTTTTTTIEEMVISESKLHDFLQANACTDIFWFESHQVTEEALEEKQQEEAERFRDFHGPQHTNAPPPPPGYHPDDEETTTATANANANNLYNYDKHELMDHSLFLLCGGTDWEEREEPPDGGFMLIGFFVGLVMVGMLFSELQAWDNNNNHQQHRPTTNATTGGVATTAERRSARSSSSVISRAPPATRRRRDYTPAFTSEFEMV